MGGGMGGQKADPVGPCLGGFVGSWTLAKQTNALGPGQSGRHMWGRCPGTWDLLAQGSPRHAHSSWHPTRPP